VDVWEIEPRRSRWSLDRDVAAQTNVFRHVVEHRRTDEAGLSKPIFEVGTIMENPVYPSVLGLIRYDAGCAIPKEKYEQKKSECFLNNPELFPNEN